VAFSCYIWNIEQTLKIARTLKKIQPTLKTNEAWWISEGQIQALEKVLRKD